MDPATFDRRPLEYQFRERRNIMQIVRIGLDLAKNVFEVHDVDVQDKAVLRKTLRRDAVIQFLQICHLYCWNGGLQWIALLGKGTWPTLDTRFA